MKSKVDVCIDLDNKKWKIKKLNPEDNLKVVREQLGLQYNLIFKSNDDYELDIEDEEEYALNSCLIEKEKKFVLNLITSDCEPILVNIYLNKEKIFTGKYSSHIKLKDISKDYESLLPKNAILLYNGYQVDIEDYEQKKISDILENNSIYYESEEIKKLKTKKNLNHLEQKNNVHDENNDEENLSQSKETSFENNGIEDIKEKIYIKIGDNEKIKKLKITEKLSDLRNKLKNELNYRFQFLENNVCIEESEESQWNINDILTFEEHKKIINIKNCEMNNQCNENLKTIKFCNDEQTFCKLNLNINQTLDDIRDEISEYIKEDFLFMKNRKEINEDEESKYSLKKIIKDDSVKIKILCENNGISHEKKEKITFIKFKLNGKEYFADKLNHNLTLFEIRKNFKLISDEIKFLKDGFEVSDEKNAKIEDILVENEFIHLRENEESKKTAPPPVNISQEKKKYKIYLNDKFLKLSQYEETTSLDNLRQLLSTTISDNELFISSDNEEIPIDNEAQWTLFDLCSDTNKIIKIKTIKTPEPEKPKIELSEPVEGSKLLGKEGDLDIYLYPNQKFNQIENSTCKTIMVLGETGSGKTTLLNSFLNFLLGIKYEDKFRYKIIVEDKSHKSTGESVTDNVNIYNIHINNSQIKIPYFKIVDTPGFGDTRGLDFDKKIIDMIEDTFKNHCDSINAICFVAKSNETRLSDHQKYILGEVMSIFGKDVGENFIAMLTFCDGQVPNIVPILESKESKFSEIKEQINDPWYLTFNNSAIFCGIKQKFTETFWNIGMDSFRAFLGKLRLLPPKSLILTKEVLDLRRRLEATIIGLRPQIDRSLVIMENIRKQISYIKANKDKIDQAKDFEIEYKAPKTTKKNLEQGVYTSNCLICNYTCHYPCYIPENEKKMNCSAIRKDFCTVCKNRCRWDNHKNLNFIYVHEEVTKKRTSDELKKKYVESNNSLKQSEQILKGLEKEFLEILSECYKNTEEINKCVEQLKKDSLCKNPNESFEDYINTCIISEEQEKRNGYLDRIKSYELLKDTNQRIIKAFKGQSAFKDLDEYKEFIDKEKKEVLKMFEKEEEKKSSCILF